MDPVEVALGQAINRVNDVLPNGNTIQNNPDTILLGEGAQLDSMGFINFVVALEDSAAELGIRINLSEALNKKDAAVPATMTVADLARFLRVLMQNSGGEQP